MAVANFVKGTLVEVENHQYKLLRQVDKGLWQLEDQANGRIQDYSKLEMEKLYVNSKLIFINDGDYQLDQKVALARRNRDDVALIQTNPVQLKMLQEKRAYVMCVEHLPVTERIMKPAILQVWEKLGGHGEVPHWTTVSRWKKKYIHSGKDAHALKNRDYRKGNHLQRYPENVIRIVESCIEEQYLTRESRTVADTLDHAIVMVERENKHLPSVMQLPLPTRRLVQTSINKIDVFDRYAARNGNLAAIKKFRSVLHMNVTDRPLECAEIDHTLLDLMVIDAETGMPWGRPLLTVCIDRNTRCILGIYVGFETASYLAVSRCLKHVFMPKVDLQQDFPDIENEWQAHGVMEKLIVDNGREFHSNSLESACLALGIDLQYTPRKTPWWKGDVERVIGTINRGVAHGIPGTTFSNIFDKGDYDPVKNAVITLDVLKKMLHKWITDVYHQKPHCSLDWVTPAAKWISSIKPEDINLPDNPARLDAILGSADHRTLTHKGIEYEGMFYNSLDMAGLRRQKGDKLKVDIRIDTGDLGHIYVIDPDDEQIFRVPCLDLEYANGLTSWQHGVCKRYAQQHLNLGSNSNAWRHAKVAISEMVQEEMLGGKKRKTNAKAARFVNASTKKLNHIESSQPQYISENTTVNIGSSLLTISSGVPTGVQKKFKPIIESRQPN